MAAAVAAVVLSGDGLGGVGGTPMTEVVVTLKAPPLSRFGRSLQSASHAAYLKQIEAAQAVLTQRIETSLPGSSVRWHYRLVADGLAVVLPKSETAKLADLPGVAEVWPNVTYHSLASADNVQQIGAEELWGADLSTAGEGVKIGIIDDGLDAAQPYFNPAGFDYPPGYPKGQMQYTTPKVIVERAFPPAGDTYKYADVPFDPAQSYHATHVAGIAAGDNGTNAKGTIISGVAPKAYLGNYKVLTVPTPGFGLDGNSAEIAAGIEAAVADGMNVINLSIGEPEVSPSRDLVIAAIDGAAAAGVVPVVAAGNDFDTFGYGSVNSPGSAPGAITVAAADSSDVIADFSSAGPTPVSLLMKPDVTGPGVDILSSLPPSQGLWGLLSGTSMSTPAVSGGAALLKQQHPDWTVAEVKSALEQTGDPVGAASGAETPALREGGGLIDLPRADNPLLFAEPANLSFGELAPGATASADVALSDAGGGAGTWTVTTDVQEGTGAVTVAPQVTVPGTLTVAVTAAAATQDETGFIVLTNGTNVRRIPFWFATSAPKLGTEPAIALTKPGVYRGTTIGGKSLISSYRYPTGGSPRYLGPERVYRVHVNGTAANAGVVVLSGNAIPHATFDGNENHVAGYTGLPFDFNPYRALYGEPRKIAAVVLPDAGWYDFVFDTLRKGGPFTFRYWVNDHTPPTLKLKSLKGAIVVSATDAGSGVDPVSISAKLDGKVAHVLYSATAHTVTIPAAEGRHSLVLSVADYEETKNMEDVPAILPNTATLRTTVRVR
ncbi:MAG TPA: S8 family serine peptidase [Gaiellaceae bacterium]|nr:S8 family serine peptidase [Gaiellaceae bacterium]